MDYGDGSYKIVDSGFFSEVFIFDLNHDTTDDYLWFDMDNNLAKFMLSSDDDHNYNKIDLSYLKIPESIESIVALDTKWLSDNSLSTAFAGVSDTGESEVYNFLLSPNDLFDIADHFTAIDIFS